jgi:hypothetical protein
MNRPVFRVLVVAAVAAAGLVPASTASAAPGKHHPKGPRGTIKICSAHVAKVYADGPSARVDDLATFYQSGECTHWKPVLPGRYEVGFAWRVPAEAGTPMIQCVIKRHHKKVYKVFNGQGVVKTSVEPNQVTEIDLYDYRG